MTNLEQSPERTIVCHRHSMKVLDVGHSRAYGDEFIRVPTVPGKPGKMRVHLENLEIWNFEKFNKYHGKMI